MTSGNAAVWIEVSLESFVTTCIGCAVSALLVYDWLLTFDREVRLIWRRPRTGASVLYFFTRYIIIVENMVDNITIYPVSDMGCTSVMWTAEVLACLGLIGPGLFSALRVKALMGESRILPGIVLALGLIPFFVNVGPAYKLKTINLPPPLGCQLEVDEPFSVHEIFVLMSSISAIVSGVVVIVVTWAKLYRSSKLARHTIHGRTVLQTMLEYGTIYFVIILVLDILQLAFYFLSLQAVMGTSYIALFLDPLTSILICRFILNLRETNEQPQVSSTPSSLTLEFGMSPSSLPSFIQSMAGPVHFTLTTNDTYTTSDNVFLGDLDEL